MNLHFVKTTSKKAPAQYVAHELTSRLKRGERILWLIAGGSVIHVAIDIAQHLRNFDLSRLTVSLTDERPGPVGHPDSNWLGLMSSGFELRYAHLQPVLTDDSTKSETAAFNRFLREQLERNDFKLGLFGIGPDGHTAGLPAQNTLDSDQFADYYEEGSFRRISATPKAIAELDEAVAYVMGEAKHPQLKRLEQNLPYSEQSAQALKGARKLTVFCDLP